MNVSGMLCINYALIFIAIIKSHTLELREHIMFIYAQIYSSRETLIAVCYFFLTNQTVLSTGLAEEVLIYTQNTARWELFLQSLWFLTSGVFT